MEQHRIRLLVIAALWALSFAGIVLLVALGVTEGTGFGVILGTQSVLTPALIDALRVEARRRSTTKRAIADDVPVVPPAPAPPASGASQVRPAVR